MTSPSFAPFVPNSTSATSIWSAEAAFAAIPDPRRPIVELTSLAGVDVRAIAVSPDDANVLSVSGGAVPSGVKVEERDLFPPSRGSSNSRR